MTDRWLRARMTAAVTLYRTRQSRLAVQTLTQNAKTRVWLRREQARAVAYRNASLRLSFWSRWCAFLAWRRRYRHLVRLFRANQLQDYMAMWRYYVATRQARREASKRALEQYGRWVYSRVWRRLARYALHQRQKRSADQHYRRRLICSQFRVWATHARVLRRMRKLLLFQGAFRLENHFRAWKRVVSLRRAQLDRLRSARAFFETTARAKCWTVWTRFVAVRKQERATLQRAVAFRRRFFSRKYLHAWSVAVDWQRRLRALHAEATTYYDKKITKRAWLALLGCRLVEARAARACPRCCVGAGVDAAASRDPAAAVSRPRPPSHGVHDSHSTSPSRPPLSRERVAARPRVAASRPREASEA
ncbi:hypothetical protein PINS_up015462 [Pythium insidiosum]|nr:hypothetical protein PINS_up015462 [Pythium insidiosum]